MRWSAGRWAVACVGDTNPYTCICCKAPSSTADVAAYAEANPAKAQFSARALSVGDSAAVRAVA
eukprot:988665-Alexandrium_andersonii.AAC.1